MRTPTPTAAKDVGVLASFLRDGRWVVGAQYKGPAVISSGGIDLRENVDVHVAGGGVLGAFKLDRRGADSAAWHRVNIRGTAVLGNVLVVHELPPGKERQLRKLRPGAAGRSRSE